MRRRGNWRGNVTLEFTLVGIPVIFIMLSTIEMARGMWIYHTLAYAIKEGTRYAVARGQNNTLANHSTYQDVCNAIIQAGAGLLQEDLTVTFHSATVGDTMVTANNCTTGQWPPGATLAKIDDQPGQTISITGSYPFVSMIAMFWPGSGRVVQFGSTNFLAASSDVMQF
jgi:Flp pilus assembly protein TadG